MESGTTILPITKAVLAIVLSYLIGSIPMGYVVARMVAGVDIRETGSGNIGLTNVIRTLGWGPGLLTGLFDFLKGYLPVFIVMKIFNPADFGGVSMVYELIVMFVSLFIILGNMFPVYLLFKGGKGVATGLGVLSALLGVYIFIPLVVFSVFLFIFRYVSLASMVAALSAPVTVILLSRWLPFSSVESRSATYILLVFTSAMALLVIYRHMSNINRILAGTEPKIGRPKKHKSSMLKSGPAESAKAESTSQSGESVASEVDSGKAVTDNQSGNGTTREKNE